MHVPPYGYDPVLQVQFVKAALPVDELEFDGQVMHVELSDAPTAEEYVPVEQALHVEAPTAVEYVPAPQSVHAADPVDTLYFPATHAVQTPLGPVHPVLQVQTGGTTSSTGFSTPPVSAPL